jgi:asparagine synthase (glutamine-hydrolysing)
VYNGEIYNYHDLRRDLLGDESKDLISFSTESDTEVLAVGLSLYGVEYSQKIDGMYAFAWFEQASEFLTLSADPFGIKQIYFYHSPDLFVFGSEFEFVCNVVRSLGRALDINQLAFECTYSFLSPCIGSTLFSNVHRLLPGEVIKIKVPSSPCIQDIVLESHSVNPHLLSDANDRSSQSWGEDSESLRSLLLQAMHSDARVATLCSGGVDSTVIALAATSGSWLNGSMPLLTARHPPSEEGFTTDYNYAHLVAEKLKLQLHSSDCSSLDWDQFCRLSDSISCPGDITAASPLYSLCSYAKDEGVKVLISGLGADEIFAGYRQHQLLALQAIFGISSRQFLAKLFHFFSQFGLLPRAMRRRLQLAGQLISSSPVESTIQSMCWGSSSADLLREFKELLIDRSSVLGIDLSHASVGSAQLLFFLHFLASTHLPVTDSVSMRFSIELRPIFLSKAMYRHFYKNVSLGEVLIPKLSLKRFLLSQFSLPFVLRSKCGFGSEPSTSKPAFAENLLGLIGETAFLSDSLKARAQSDYQSFCAGRDSRSAYGLIALAHASRLVGRIVNRPLNTRIVLGCNSAD